MKEITFDRFIRWAGLAAIVIVVLLLLNYLSSVLLPFFIAWLLAYLLYPIVKFIEDKLHLRIRALSIIVAFLMVVIVIGGMLYFIIPPMMEQSNKVQDILSQWLHQTTHTNDLTKYISTWIERNQKQITEFLHSKNFSDALHTAMPKVFTLVSQTASILLSIVASLITLLYTFFILLDYEYLTANWIKIFPKKYRPFWHELSQDAKTALNSYIRSSAFPWPSA